MNDQTLTVLALLFTIGLLYNGLTGYVQSQLKQPHGVTAWLVVGGVLWTLFGVLILTGIDTFLTVLLCFIASGTPMVIGSMARYRQSDRAR